MLCGRKWKGERASWKPPWMSYLAVPTYPTLEALYNPRKHWLHYRFNGVP